MKIKQNNGEIFAKFFIFILFYFFRSQSFDRKDNNSSRSFQDSTRSVNNSHFNNESNSGKRISREYLIDHNDVSRLIGKGGGTIKQIQRENNVQIKVSNDRQTQWVDLIISGSNDQVITNAFNHIKNIIGNIREKNESSQSKSSFQPGIFIFFQSFVLLIIFIDSGANNTSEFSFSKTHQNTSRGSNDFFSSTNQNNFRNNNQTYSNGTNNTFNSRGGGFAGLIHLFISSSILINNY
jgi:hypothetical protein